MTPYLAAGGPGCGPGNDCPGPGRHRRRRLASDSDSNLYDEMALQGTMIRIIMTFTSTSMALLPGPGGPRTSRLPADPGR